MDGELAKVRTRARGRRRAEHEMLECILAVRRARAMADPTVIARRVGRTALEHYMLESRLALRRVDAVWEARAGPARRGGEDDGGRAGEQTTGRRHDPPARRHGPPAHHHDPQDQRAGPPEPPMRQRDNAGSPPPPRRPQPQRDDRIRGQTSAADANPTLSGLQEELDAIWANADKRFRALHRWVDRQERVLSGIEERRRALGSMV